jgi:hypothetical protein
VVARLECSLQPVAGETGMRQEVDIRYVVISDDQDQGMGVWMVPVDGLGNLPPQFNCKDEWGFS